MTVRKTLPPLLFTVLFLLITPLAFAQGDTKTDRKDDDINLDTQLYLLVGTNQDVGDAKLPAALDSVNKQLHASLPFKNYRLATTLITRAKNEGHIILTWAGGPLIASSAATARTPGFNEFNVRLVRVLDDSEGHKLIRMEGFKFGARIPIETYGVAAAGTPPGPVISYENTGLNTDISMREGEPVIVGTWNVGPSGEAIIVVVSAKRAPR